MSRATEQLDRLEVVVVIDDRDRIAGDLHEVVQRLFATGLGLASTAGSCRDDATRSRLAAMTDDVDEAIRLLRRTVLEICQDAER